MPTSSASTESARSDSASQPIKSGISGDLVRVHTNIDTFLVGGRKETGYVNHLHEPPNGVQSFPEYLPRVDMIDGHHFQPSSYRLQ